MHEKLLPRKHFKHTNKIRNIFTKLRFRTAFLLWVKSHFVSELIVTLTFDLEVQTANTFGILTASSVRPILRGLKRSEIILRRFVP